MKIDFLLVRPGSGVPVEGFPDLAGSLALGLKARGYLPAILTLVEDPMAALDIPVFCLRYRDRITAGERWDPASAHAFGVRNFRRFSACEHGYVQEERRPRPHHLLSAEVPAAFSELEKLFRENEIGCVVHPVIGGEIIREATSLIARARGIPVLCNACTRYFENRTLLVADTKRTLFRRARKRFVDLPETEKSFLREYLESKRACRNVAWYWLQDRSFPKIAAAFIRDRKYTDLNRVLKGLQRTRQHADFQLSKLYWRLPRPEDSYVYFPLQYSRESTIANGCPQCQNQEYILEYLARLLPDNTKLYFKQHPHNPAEGSSLKLIRRVLEAPNAQLVPVHCNSWDLSRKARAVVTIDSSVGYDALLLGKPVVVLGCPSYRGWGVTHDVLDLNDLHEILERAFTRELSDEQILDFLASFESIHIKGNWFDEPLNPDEMATGLLEGFRQAAMVL